MWGGAALFAGSLGFFLFTYSITFGEILDGEADPRPVLFDAGLFSVFALHHSVFARLRTRDLVGRIVSPGLERSVYVVAASLMLICVCAFWKPVPGTMWQLEGQWMWLPLIAQAAGFWLTVRAVMVIDFRELAGVSQLHDTSQRPTPNSQKERETEFKTAGPYGWVRHPIYLGWILFVFGVGSMTMTRFVFAAVSTGYLLLAIPLEERTLRATAGPAYDAYMRRVPRKLIPWVY